LERHFRAIKHEIRVVGVDDAAFLPKSNMQVPVVGVVFRGGNRLEGVMCTQITVDGIDATQNIASMIKTSPHYGQLRVIMLDGVTFGGFNIVDVTALYEETNLPIIVVAREKPDFARIQQALSKLPQSDWRWRTIQKAGEILQVPSRRESERIYIQIVGISLADARKVIKLTSTYSSIPEPLRVAHMIASGISSIIIHRR
jgi:endonuclease V-like protein UPF0215 family